MFLDDLRTELARLKARRRGRRNALLRFLDQLGELRLLDPACGCGNFLIIAYRELRLLEMEVIHEIEGLAFSRIDVDQFYGIELGEFPVRIAETALWMMDHIMNNRLSLELGEAYVRIPLEKSPRIVHADALETARGGFSKAGHVGHGDRTGRGARGFAGCGSIHRHDLARGLLKSARFRIGPRRKRPKYKIVNAAIPAFKSREFLSGQILAGTLPDEIRYIARVEFKVVSRPQQFFSLVHRVYRLLTEIRIPNRFVFGIVAHRIPLLL